MLNNLLTNIHNSVITKKLLSCCFYGPADHEGQIRTNKICFHIFIKTQVTFAGLVLRLPHPTIVNNIRGTSTSPIDEPYLQAIRLGDAGNVEAFPSIFRNQIKKPQYKRNQNILNIQ